MSKDAVSCIGSVIALAVLVAGVTFLLRRRRERGGLFTGEPTVASRIAALVLGVVLIGLATFEMLYEPVMLLCDITLWVAGLACLLYGLGVYDLMRSIQ